MSDPTPNDPTKIKPRLTIVENVYHQTPPKGPKSIASQFVRTLETHEQVYERELTATEEWQPLLDERCWLNECSHVHVANDEGKYLTANPTDEEREATAAKVLEVGYQPMGAVLTPEGVFSVPPGETFRGTPLHPRLLRIRSQSGEAHFTLHVIPR